MRHYQIGAIVVCAILLLSQAMASSAQAQATSTGWTKDSFEQLKKAVDNYANGIQKEKPAQTDSLKAMGLSGSGLTLDDASGQVQVKINVPAGKEKDAETLLAGFMSRVVGGEANAWKLSKEQVDGLVKKIVIAKSNTPPPPPPPPPPAHSTQTTPPSTPSPSTPVVETAHATPQSAAPCPTPCPVPCATVAQAPCPAPIACPMPCPAPPVAACPTVLCAPRPNGVFQGHGCGHSHGHNHGHGYAVPAPVWHAAPAPVWHAAPAAMPAPYYPMMGHSVAPMAYPTTIGSGPVAFDGALPPSVCGSLAVQGSVIGH